MAWGVSEEGREIERESAINERERERNIDTKREEIGIERGDPRYTSSLCPVSVTGQQERAGIHLDIYMRGTRGGGPCIVYFGVQLQIFHT